MIYNGFMIHKLIFCTRMFILTTCAGLSFSGGSEKRQFRIFLSPTQRHLPSSQHVVPDSAADDTICCVISLTCDAPRRDGKQRYDYFLSVVHFRKVVIFRKVGSDGNGSPVIYRCDYSSTSVSVFLVSGSFCRLYDSLFA